MRTTIIVGIIAGLSALTYGFLGTPTGKKLMRLPHQVREVAEYTKAASTFQADGRWWDCSHLWDKVPCSTEAVDVIRFTADEIALKSRLDSLSAPPARVTEEDLIALMGAPAKKVTRKEPVVELEWPGVTPSARSYGNVTITLAYGQLAGVQWLESSQYFILRRYEIKSRNAVQR